MNPFLAQVVTQAVLRKRKKTKATNQRYSDFELAKGYRELQINLVRLLKDILLISMGIGSAAFGLESFLVPS
ncbi:MAG TPA: hypothetical protein PLW44_18795, partial [Chitinophagales bacterium]|nr:hypothetical protein [Chitinophagales bacterium]